MYYILAMSRLLLSFIILFNLSALASSLCSSVFKLDSQLDGQTISAVDSVSQWRKESSALFRANMLGDALKGEKELYFYWHTANPFNLEKLTDTQYANVESNKRMRIYRNQRDLNAENPLEITNTFLARQNTSNREMLNAFIANYNGRVSEPIVKAVKELENLMAELANMRQSFGYVATAPAEAGGTMLGTFRIYNGSPNHSNTPSLLPMEYSFLKDQVQTQISDRLNKMRMKDPNILLFEIGKFSLNAPVDSQDRVHNMLALFLLRYYIDVLPADTLYFAHAVSKAHVRLYKSRYGFKVVEEVIVPGQPEKEYVLEATGAQIRAATVKFHNLPSIGVEIIRPAKDQ